MRWQLSFILKIVQISHLTSSWLHISGQRATQAGLYFSSHVCSPLPSFMWISISQSHQPAPFSPFIHFYLQEPSSCPLSRAGIPAHPKPRVPELLGLWLTDLCSSLSPHQIHLHKEESLQVTFLSRQFAAVWELMDVGALLVTFISNNLCNLKGRALPAVQRFNYQLCCWSAELPWASGCHLVF